MSQEPEIRDVWKPPRAPVENAAPAENPDAAITRRRHANHEASIKAMAWIYLFATCIAILPQVARAMELGKYGTLYEIVAFALMFGLALLCLWIMLALRQFDPWARIVTGVLAVLGMLEFPVGTAFNGYFLYLLFSRKGNTIFSKAYRDVVAQTPEIEGGASMVVILFMAVYVVLGMFAGMAWLYRAP